MNVLWIEDFGKLPANDTTLSTYFNGLLSKEIILTWNPEFTLIDEPRRVRDFFAEHSKTHCVDLITSYSDFAERLENSTLLREFDVIVIDINLSSGLKVGQIPSEFETMGTKFFEMAGIYIYNTLIRRCFPENNICLLTGEVTTVKSLKDHFKLSLNPSPRYFDKNNLEPFRDWLSELSQDEYIRLRRGVIDGCNEMRALVGREPDTYRFPDLLRDSSDQPSDDYDEHLDLLEHLLPTVPLADSGNVRLLFVRALCHDWDNTRVDTNNFWKVTHSGATKASRELQGCGYTLINARNWLAHNNLTEAVTFKLAALLFIINLRLRFKLPGVVLPYEHQLFDLISEPCGEAVDPLKKIKEDYYNVFDRYSALPELVGIQKDSKTDYYNQMVKILVTQKKAEYGEIETWLFRMIWQVVYQVNLRKPPTSSTVGQFDVEFSNVLFRRTYQI